MEDPQKLLDAFEVRAYDYLRSDLVTDWYHLGTLILYRKLKKLLRHLKRSAPTDIGELIALQLIRYIPPLTTVNSLFRAYPVHAHHRIDEDLR